MANIMVVWGMARRSTQSPDRASRWATRLSITARFVVGAFAILAVITPITMEERALESVRLVDDGGGSSSSDPPYSPSPSRDGSSTPGGNEPGDEDGDDGENGDGGDGSSVAEGAAGLPVAAQAGISLGVLALAAAALIPGRRPPAHLR